MTPERESNMRAGLAELGQEELCDTCVQMQQVIDTHVSEKTGLTSSISAMQKQIPALQESLAEAEAAASGASSDEVDTLNAEIERLTLRVDELQGLNEGLTKKLLG
jgi:peptidoglycan hydrolase CwlO-like protein